MPGQLPVVEVGVITYVTTAVAVLVKVSVIGFVELEPVAGVTPLTNARDQV